MELQALGIDPERERAYRALVASGGLDAASLAEHAGFAPDAAAAGLIALEEAGLAHRDGATFRAAPPAVALRALLVRRRTELGQAESALAELTELFSAAASGRTVRDLVDVVSGADAVRQRFGQIQDGAVREVVAFVQAKPMLVRASENQSETTAVERGVQYRVVLERSVLSEPGGLEGAESAARDGELLRIAPSLPIRMIIADQEAALVPVAAGGEPGAIIVYPSGLLDALIALFELFWARSVVLPARGNAADGPDLTGEELLDQRIVTLLLQGVTDAAIASQLGVSARTVQRRIRVLMDHAGASTRLQLGYHLRDLLGHR